MHAGNMHVGNMHAGNMHAGNVHIQVGVTNADTDDAHQKSKFRSSDFLLVMQSPDQASMLASNPRILCVDATHGLTAYNYYLLSIVAVDKHGHGLSVAQPYLHVRTRKRDTFLLDP